MGKDSGKVGLGTGYAGLKRNPGAVYRCPRSCIDSAIVLLPVPSVAAPSVSETSWVCGSPLPYTL